MSLQKFKSNFVNTLFPSKSAYTSYTSLWFPATSLLLTSIIKIIKLSEFFKLYFDFNIFSQLPKFISGFISFFRIEFVVIVKVVLPSLIFIFCLLLYKILLLKFVVIISLCILYKIKLSFISSSLYFNIHDLSPIVLIPQK